MPKFLIERSIAGVQQLSASELQAIAQKSCNVLCALGPQIQWLQSYVMEDKLYCLYIAPDAALIKAHAKQGHFPVDTIREVKAIMDATTAEGCLYSKADV